MQIHLLIQVIGICEDVTEHGLRETLEDFDSGRQVKASNVLYYFFFIKFKKNTSVCGGRLRL